MRDEATLQPWVMRGNVLIGAYYDDGDKPRTIAQLREAARCFARAAEIKEARGDTEGAKAQSHNEAVALCMVELKAEELRASIAARK